MKRIDSLRKYYSIEITFSAWDFCFDIITLGTSREVQCITFSVSQNSSVQYHEIIFHVRKYIYGLENQQKGGLKYVFVNGILLVL